MPDKANKDGIPLEIDRGGRHLQIGAVEPVDKLANLIFQPNVIVGSPEDLAGLNWEGKESTLLHN